MTRIAVVDHGAGNLVSIARALERTGATVSVTERPEHLGDADGLVLPGVGTTAAAMERLDADGWPEPLAAWERPLLGVCVGLQLFFDRSAEDDGGRCLGLMAGSVNRLDDAPLLPHIGWNDVDMTPHPIFAGLTPGTPFYFVHSYAPLPTDPGIVIGRTTYGATFVSAVARANRVGVQFHPERSGRAGLHLLGNFVRSCGGASRAA